MNPSEHIDRLIEGLTDWRGRMLADIRNDLADFGVVFDRWYSERTLATSGAIDHALEVLRSQGRLYERDGASWFRATEFGDDEDRVVVRANGEKTYFASDIAYHLEKRERGFDLLVDVLGADHHGYVARVRGGLVAGAAAASKYTELQFPGLIVLTLVIASVWRRKHFTALVAFGVASIPIAIYPYVRNLLLLGNPIYPFLWGHPHMSDETMAAIVSELTSVFDPSYRGYVRDMRTAEGWIDLGAVVWRVFLDHQKYTQAAIAFLLAGSFFRRSALAIPALWSVALLLIWYQAMFNHPRWALAFHMHLIAAGYIALMWLIAEWRSVGAALPMGRLLVPAAGLLMRVRSLALPMLARRSSAMLGLGLLVALECGMTAMRVSSIGLHAAFPAWLDHRMVPGLAAGAGPQAFLEETRPGYRLYRFIGEHDLRTVFQPFDNGAFLYQAAYNNGRSNDWILPHYILPKDEGDLDSFVARNSIRYFIDRQQLTPTEHERLGPENIALARALIARLKPRSRLVLADSMGSELWAVEATAGR